MSNIGMYIDHETRDLIFDEETNDFMFTEDAETIAQCNKATLQVYKEEWFLDLDHGTAYQQILGVKPKPSDATIQRVLREAIYQEPGVKYVRRLDYDMEKRKMAVNYEAVLDDGTVLAIGTEV